MKRGTFATIGLLVSALAAFPAFGQEDKPEPTAATPVWGARCADCHGLNGEGVNGKAASLLTDAAMAEAKDRVFFESLRNAAADSPHSLPGIKEMSEEQTWSLIVHLREMQAKDWRRRVGDPKGDKSGVFSSRRAKFKIETVISDGLRTPWSIEWLPSVPNGGGMAEAPALVLVTELGRTAENPPKPPRLNIYQNGKHLGAAAGLPKIASRGQGGLMDVAAHPDYIHNGWVYITYAEPSEDGRNEMTKVVRGRLKQTEPHDADTGGWTFTDQQVIFQPRKGNYNGPGVHYGSRIVFQKPSAEHSDEAKGRWYVFFVVGERGGNEQAQDLERPNGKIHRVWDDGQIPSDNPFVKGSAGPPPQGVYTSIWTLGHRNPQGLCFDDQGNLWDTEHGPRGGDELNLLKPGGNYGWPQACFGINYSDQPFVTPWKETAKNGMPLTLPVHRWLPSIAACGLDCARAAAVKSTFPDWSGDLFAGGLAGNTLQRLRITDGKVAEQEELIHNMGRVRDAAFGPDGNLYIVLNGPDKVVRLVPVK